MLIGSCLLIITILSCGTPLIPAAPNPSHDAVKLNIFQTGCAFPLDRQNISIATFHPIRYLPGSKNSLPCTALTPAVVGCNMTVLQSHPLIIAVELRATNCTINTYADSPSEPSGWPMSLGYRLPKVPIDELHTNDPDTNDPHLDVVHPRDVVHPKFPLPFNMDEYYIELKMHIDSNFALVPGSLSYKKHFNVLPPTTAHAKDLASSISPSVALANCAAGFIFGTGKILKYRTPIPTDCIVAHSGVPGFAHHVVIGDGFADYMTDKEILELPAPESRSLLTAATNNLVFNNNMYNALSQAYTETQLLVNDMKFDLVPATYHPSINKYIGDLLIASGIFLPLVPFGAWTPLVQVIGGVIILAGTVMNEQSEESSDNVFDIVQNYPLQKIQETTQASFINVMNTTFYSDQNYTAFDDFFDGDFQNFTQIKAAIKEQAVGWSASQFLNYFGLIICNNPDTIQMCHFLEIPMFRTNDKILNTTTDCLLGGGYYHDGKGYLYFVDNGQPQGNIVNFEKYLPNGSYNNLCYNWNGWNITTATCCKSEIGIFGYN